MTASRRLICLAAQQSGNGQDAGTSAEATSSTEPANPPIQSRAITTVTQATPTPGPSVPVSHCDFLLGTLFPCSWTTVLL